MEMPPIEPMPLSLDEVQQLEEKDRTDYLALRRLFESDGWKRAQAIIIGWQQGAINDQLIAKDWDTVQRCRGAFSALERVRTLEAATEALYAQSARREEESEEV